MSEPNTEPVGSDNQTSDADETSKALSLMGGVVRPEGLPEADDFSSIDKAKSNRKFLSQGTMLILIVFVIAAGTLYGMRLSNHIDGPSAHIKTMEAKVDQALAKLSAPQGLAKNDALQPANIKKLFEDTDQIVSMFSADLTQRQVPIRFVKKNPFVLPVFQSVREESDAYDAEDSAKAEQKRIRMLKQELGHYELQSIMQGSRPVAVINGELVQPGQRIGSFKLIAIHNRSVELQNGGTNFTLTMENQADKQTPSFRRFGGR